MTYREFQDSREGFDVYTGVEYEAYMDEYCYDDCGDDMSEYDDDCDCGDEPWDGFRDAVDADADVLRMAGYGTDEDYGYDGMDYDFGLDG